jgi:hypothetical protein
MKMPKLPKLPKLAAPAAPEPPKSLWEKVLNYTPIVMTVIATLLAGMSNSELSAAQYERAAAAQHQSKAGDQWNYFQGKKLRGLSMDNTLDLLQSMGNVAAFDPAALESTLKTWPVRLEKLGPSAPDAARACNDLTAALAKDGVKEALTAANSGPQFTPKPIADAKVRAAADAISAAKPDADIATLVKGVSEPSWNDALKTAEDDAKSLDAMVSATNKALDSIRPPLERLCALVTSTSRTARAPADQDLAAEVRATTADFAAARLRFGARRYALEAPLNQQLALLTEIRVHQANIEAEHHRTRSRLFFVGSLIAQAAVIGATLALAMKQKNVLWSLAAVAGIAAISFGVYVRMFV